MPVNNVYKNSFRVLHLVTEETFSNDFDARSRQTELKKTGTYHMVKVTRFRFGSKHERSYRYAVRAYKKSQP